jgi:hypothetical protein
MRTTIVRYKVKPARLDEHVALVKAVFEELSRLRPAGLRYSAVRRQTVSALHTFRRSRLRTTRSARWHHSRIFNAELRTAAMNRRHRSKCQLLEILPYSPRAPRARESHSVPGRAAPFVLHFELLAASVSRQSDGGERTGRGGVETPR